MKPRLLILDEPAAGLDPRGRDEIFDHVRAYLASGDTAAVIVSHSMDDVARIADRIIVMGDGRIQLNGTPKEVFSNRAAIENAGLRLPFVSRVMHMLRDRGFNADVSVLDVESAAKAILKLKGREV